MFARLGLASVGIFDTNISVMVERKQVGQGVRNALARFLGSYMLFFFLLFFFAFGMFFPAVK